METIDSVELLVSELLTNSIVHADLRPNQDVDLRLRCGADAVRVEVADPGASFEPDYDPPRGGPGRWGFYLVSKLADRWGVDDQGAGKAVWFEIDL
jgi:anti-sigma regulatory factor (Ser/Thr protein kinase)